MEYLALYRKYRPSSLEDFVGQKEVVKTIQNSIINKKISHAYIFAGPRGTGKTSMAKIVAKMINCENLKDGRPCNECRCCTNIINSNDIIEIDAASNNGIDEIRELKEKTRLMPSISKYKVYIIDEVHMMTIQAFNALLKTLEEPPEHVIFILATTELNKLPITIVSRCQKFLFKKISDADISERLKYIAIVEKISIEHDAIEEITKLSDGGLRDAINLLDQLNSYKQDKILKDDVYSVTGLISSDSIYELLIDLKLNNNQKLIEKLETLYDMGKSSSKIVEEILKYIKEIIVYSNILPAEKDNLKEEILNKFTQNDLNILIEDLINILNRIKTVDYANIYLITNVIKISNKLAISNETINVQIPKVQQIETTVCDSVIEQNTKEEKNIKENKIITTFEKKDNRIVINNALATADKQKLISLKNKWEELIANLEKDSKMTSVLEIINDTIPVVVGDSYILCSTKYESSLKIIDKHFSKIESVINNILNNKNEIVFLEEKEWLEVKKKYIKDTKQGIKYKKINNYTKKENLKEKIVTKTSSPVDKLLDLLGDEIIEYKN